MSGETSKTVRRLNWSKIQVGWYEATDPQGTEWRIVEGGYRRWEVYRPADATLDFVAATFREGMLFVEQEVAERLDPALRTIREARRATRNRGA